MNFCPGLKWMIPLLGAVCLASASCRTPDAAREKSAGANSPVVLEIDKPETQANTPPEDRVTHEGATIDLPGENPPLLPPDGMLRIGLKDAVLLAISNNRSLIVQRLTPSIRQTYEDEALARFDPILSAATGVGRQRSEELSRASSDFTPNTSSKLEFDAGISQYFATGAEINAGVSTDRTWSDWYSNKHQSRLGVSVTQSLLQGAGADVNLAALRQARLDTQASQYEFRGFAQALVAVVEKTYWEYALALRQIEIYEESLKLANQYLDETKAIISVGKLAETELIAAEAEMALRRQDLIDAKSKMESTRLRLLRLLAPAGENVWGSQIFILDMPLAPDVFLDDTEDHVRVALRMRPDLNQARLEIDRGELEIVKTKNGVLPLLDVFLTLGKSGYSDSFGGSLQDIPGDNYDALVGFRARYPLRNRSALARHRRAELGYDQAVAAVENLAQLVEVDVRTAHLEVGRAKKQIAATAATRKLQEEKLRIETEKFRVGRSTNFLVAQAWRDVVSSQISESEATVSYLKSLIELYRLEGSLLERRGISAPGRDPVKAH